MSDDSSSKGWDGWFSAEQDSSGGEEGSAAGRSVPESAPEPAPEAEAEQTDWTMPAVKGDAQPPAGRRTQPRAEPEAEAEPEPAAETEPEAEREPEPELSARQPRPAEPVSAPEPEPESAEAQQPIAWNPAPNPEPEPEQEPRESETRVPLAWSPEPQAPAEPPAAEVREPLKWSPEPQAQPRVTEAQEHSAWSPEHASSLPTESDATPDSMATHVVHLENPDAMATRIVVHEGPSRSASADTQLVNQPGPDGMATQLVNQPTPEAAPTQLVPQTPAPAQDAGGTWQPPQSAQMWGEPRPSAQQQSPSSSRSAHGYAVGPGQDAAPAAAAGVQHGQQEQRPAQPFRIPEPEPTVYQPQVPRRPSAPPAEDFATDEERRPGSRKKVYLASGIGAAAIVGLATVLVLNQGGLTGAGASANATPSGFQPTGTTVTADAQETAQAFLTAWESGNFKQAASYTDDSAAAQSTLAAFSSNLNLHGLTLAATGSTALAAASASAGASATGSASASASASASYGAAAPTSTAGAGTFSVVAKVGLPSASASSTSSSSSSASSSAGASSSSSTSTSTSDTSAVSADWSYSSKVVAYKKNGGWWIQWSPSLVAPNLTADEKIVSVALSPSASEVVDDAGNSLSSATDPGVHNIYNALKKSAPAGQGTPGVEIVLENADGTQISSSTDVLSQPVNTGVVKTTINAKAEAAAQAAVQKYSDSSMVVLQPSTGDILAVANNDGGNDFALTARIAPGSTNKIITATALLANGEVSSPSQAVTCPAKITVDGTVFANSQNESEPAGTPFLTDFAVSCNNAFGQWYDKIGSTTLAQTAEKYYGLNQQWNLGTGLAGPYYQIPSSSSNGELFQELFGQGQLETAPLAMASVAATVDTGTFKQPIVVQGASQLTATSLPTNVQQGLWQMMKAVTNDSEGTAYNVFSGVNSTVYGKTGTADVGATQTKPNSWMVVFDPTLDVAIATVVLDAGYGASYAGPESAVALAAMQ